MEHFLPSGQMALPYASGHSSLQGCADFSVIARDLFPLGSQQQQQPVVSDVKPEVTTPELPPCSPQHGGFDVEAFELSENENVLDFSANDEFLDGLLSLLGEDLGVGQVPMAFGSADAVVEEVPRDCPSPRGSLCSAAGSTPDSGSGMAHARNDSWSSLSSFDCKTENDDFFPVLPIVDLAPSVIVSTGPKRKRSASSAVQQPAKKPCVASVTSCQALGIKRRYFVEKASTVPGVTGKLLFFAPFLEDNVRAPAFSIVVENEADLPKLCEICQMSSSTPRTCDHYGMCKLCHLHATGENAKGNHHGCTSCSSVYGKCYSVRLYREDVHCFFPEVAAFIGKKLVKSGGVPARLSSVFHVRPRKVAGVRVPIYMFATCIPPKPFEHKDGADGHHMRHIDVAYCQFCDKLHEYNNIPRHMQYHHSEEIQALARAP